MDEVSKARVSNKFVRCGLGAKQLANQRAVGRRNPHQKGNWPADETKEPSKG